MRIREIISNALMKTSIFEMAFSKADAIRRTSDLQFQISKHMIKVYMYNESEHVNHWCNELNSWLHKIQDFILKGTKKPLPYESLYEILFKQPMESVDEVQRHMNKIYQQYTDLKIDEPDSGVVHSKIERAMHDICTAIANDKFLNVKDYL